MIIKNLERYRNLYYNGNREEDVMWLTALTSRNFTELYNIVSKILPKEKVIRFMEGAINMSKDEFVLHEWNRELFDDLVKSNEIENAKKEGKILGIEEGNKAKSLEVVKKMLEKEMNIKDISEITGLSEKEI